MEKIKYILPISIFFIVTLFLTTSAVNFESNDITVRTYVGNLTNISEMADFTIYNQIWASWSGNITSYSTTAQANALYYGINNPYSFYNSTSLTTNSQLLNGFSFYNSTSLTTNSQLLNGFGFWNDTYATFNKTYADTLYYDLGNSFGYYNQTSFNVSDYATLAYLTDAHYNKSEINAFDWINNTLGDVRYYNIDNPFGFYNSTSLQNLTQLTNNLGIGNWTLDKPDYYTATQINAFDWTNNTLNDVRYRLLTNHTFNGATTFTGQANFNGDWTTGGASIINGDGYFQTVYAYNFSGLNVYTLATNGSLVPTLDNQFDLGEPAMRWDTAYIGTALINNGTGYFGGNVGIGTTSPVEKLDVNGSIQSTGSFISSASYVFLKSSGGTNTVFRGIRAPTAWSDAVDTQWFQVGNNDDYVMYTAQSGTPTTRTGFVTNTFHITTSANRAAPVGLFDISNGNTKLFNVLSDGNVGIGTTAPAYPLQVRRAGGAGSLGISIDGVGTTDRTVQYFAVQDDAAGVGAGHAFYYRGPSSTTDVAGMVLTEDGNVGIGTTAPGAKLDIEGTTTEGQDILTLNANAATQRLTLHGNGDVVTTFLEAGGTIGLFGTVTNHDFRIRTNYLDRMSITKDGNVGIGTTAPGDKLEVNGIIYSNNVAIGGDSTNAGERMRLRYNSADAIGHLTGTSGVGLSFGTGGVEDRIRITNSGNVGIGTAAPSVGLQLNMTNPAIAINAADDNNGARLQLLGSNTNKNWQISNQWTQGSFEIIPSTIAGGSTFSTPAMVILDTGNVGIGTTSPQNKLNVNGSINQTNGNFTGNNIYGGMWYTNYTATSLNFAVDGQFYYLFMQNATNLNGFVAEGIEFGGTSNLTAQIGGVYQVNYMATGDGQNNHVYHTSIFINGVNQMNCDTQHKLAAGGDILTQTGTCLIRLAIGDKVSLRTADVGSTGTGNYYGANLDIVRIGN